MSDEESLDQGSVETDNPDVETTDTTDWEKQYKALQPEYTRNQQALKDATSVWEDEQALIARIAEKYPHLIADEETDDDEFDDDNSSDETPEPMTKAEFQAWQTDQQAQKDAEKEQQRFEADFKKFVGDRELDQYGDAALRVGSYKNPEELEAAINGYFDYLDTLGAKPRKKRPTSPLPGGKAVTGVPDYSDMTREQIDQYMAERVRALEAQT